MNRIKELRAEKNITQEVLAKLLGIEVAGISKLETGRVPLKDDYILKLAEFFDVNTDYLLGKSDIKKVEDVKFAYHKETEGLSEEEIKDALEIYKNIKYGNIGKKKEK